jgi:hypothetical protein
MAFLAAEKSSKQTYLKDVFMKGTNQMLKLIGKIYFSAVLKSRMFLNGLEL